MSAWDTFIHILGYIFFAGMVLSILGAALMGFISGHHHGPHDD